MLLHRTRSCFYLSIFYGLQVASLGVSLLKNINDHKANQVMKCIEMKEPGAADVLFVAERETPEIQPDEVLIKVAYAGVNRPDIIQRMGHYPPPKGASDLLGLEVAGEVVKVGSEVTGVSIGQKVCALTNGGGYAQYCPVPFVQCLAVPAGMDLAQAACLPETFFTVWFNLYTQGNLQSGQSLLVHGGTSGIGTTAIQMATALGVTVFATAGSDEKCKACTELGAKRAINYKDEDFVDVIQEETQGRGVNMILDMVGGDYIARNIKCLQRKGRLINIAYLKGAKAEVNFMMVMLKQLEITGSTLRIQPAEVKAGIARDLLKTVWPLLEKQTIAPVLYKTFPMKEAAEAHRLMESNAHIGKIVLDLTK